MEYAKDEIFNIHYNPEKNTLESRTSPKKKTKKISKQSKWLSMFILLGLSFGIINCILILDFFKILTNM